MAAFRLLYEQWLDRHIGQRKGERKRRLVEGHGHAENLFIEKVWFPAFRQLDHLHPEFEVADFRDGSRFLDFAYIRNPIRLAIEIDGYGPHSSKISRTQFSDSLMRQNHLMIDGWRVLRFSYDDVNERPRMCQQILQQFLGSQFGESTPQSDRSNIVETEVLRLALRLQRSLRPRDVCDLLQVNKKTAYLILRRMVEKQSLQPVGRGEQRVRCYSVNPIHINEKK
ncbi:DNA-binding response regulator [Paenibacillus mendelii]|uniref:DNA-binding response regulator n=1 Tax=Paenibacillus mendelii TaxID=206163 RepID=A0ABV6JDU1_9BACL|nr:DNA-binding response regulator [Paenibacillus mendelii]MCQ6561624.1 endonuclease domain-containing protein [Paenibacillus mendelii]